MSPSSTATANPMATSTLTSNVPSDQDRRNSEWLLIPRAVASPIDTVGNQVDQLPVHRPAPKFR